MAAASFLRIWIKNGVGVLTFPVAVSIERLFFKNGVALGTLILTFIFVNFEWALLAAAYALNAAAGLVTRSASAWGTEAASALLIMLGSYYYTFPLGGLAVLFRLLLFHGEKNTGAAETRARRLYRLLDYLCVVVPVAVWTYTFFSYRILAAFRVFTPEPGSFFIPGNFFAYFQVFFPVADGVTHGSALDLLAGLGALMGVVHSTKLIGEEIFSQRAHRPEQVRHALWETWDKEESRGTRTLFIAYTLLVLGLILYPGLVNQGTAPLNGPRLASMGFLLLPVFFHLGLCLYRTRHGRAAAKPI